MIVAEHSYLIWLWYLLNIVYKIHFREFLTLNATKYWVSFFAGNNCELSTSYCESANEVKGDPPACHNGGTCLPDENSFTCSCAPGFTGTILLYMYRYMYFISVKVYMYMYFNPVKVVIHCIAGGKECVFWSQTIRVVIKYVIYHTKVLHFDHMRRGILSGFKPTA